MAIVKLYGNLKQYGDKFNMSVETAAEAMNGLYCQIKGLKKQIMDGYFRVRINGVDMNEDNLRFGLHSRIPQDAVIHIVPQVAGAKGGFLSAIAGAVMVVVGAWTGQYWLVGMGVGMMVGGVAMMLTKLPKTDKSADGGTNKNTYFSNLDNTIAQGAPVPLCYGLTKIGSKVLSQGLETLDDATNTDKKPTTPIPWAEIIKGKENG
ncbi:tail assembly protein [Gilliamella sp. ESL0232]|uniref:tail assembly protein n=1 Tax=Gilliamella sp. ESL0232 TaxID=2705037 RepID=UPI001580D600|nr:tail assembly protein [Gilliamella sp. ESL0232]NUE95218.1 tail assembly protein [Gilliamella sp. ESL0232]